MDKIDYTKATSFRGKNGNTFPCQFVQHEDRESFWVESIEDVVDAAGLRIAAGQQLLFWNSGVHRYGRGFVLIPPSNTEEQNTMNKATFTSTDPVRTPTHWRRKGTGSVLWKAAGLWNRIDSAGNCCQQKNISTTPDTDPDQFEPCYGDLVITISADT